MSKKLMTMKDQGKILELEAEIMKLKAELKAEKIEKIKEASKFKTISLSNYLLRENVDIKIKFDIETVTFPEFISRGNYGINMSYQRMYTDKFNVIYDIINDLKSIIEKDFLKNKVGHYFQEVGGKFGEKNCFNIANGQHRIILGISLLLSIYRLAVIQGDLELSNLILDILKIKDFNNIDMSSIINIHSTDIDINSLLNIAVSDYLKYTINSDLDSEYKPLRNNEYSKSIHNFNELLMKESLKAKDLFKAFSRMIINIRTLEGDMLESDYFIEQNKSQNEQSEHELIKVILGCNIKDSRVTDNIREFEFLCDITGRNVAIELYKSTYMKLRKRPSKFISVTVGSVDSKLSVELRDSLALGEFTELEFTKELLNQVVLFKELKEISFDSELLPLHNFLFSIGETYKRFLPSVLVILDRIKNDKSFSYSKLDILNLNSSFMSYLTTRTICLAGNSEKPADQYFHKLVPASKNVSSLEEFRGCFLNIVNPLLRTKKDFKTKVLIGESPSKRYSKIAVLFKEECYIRSVFSYKTEKVLSDKLFELHRNTFLYMKEIEHKMPKDKKLVANYLKKMKKQKSFIDNMIELLNENEESLDNLYLISKQVNKDLSNLVPMDKMKSEHMETISCEISNTYVNSIQLTDHDLKRLGNYKKYLQKIREEMLSYMVDFIDFSK